MTTPTGINPDDSGGVRYQATLPVAGLLFAATPSLHLYATAGRGFETPTLNELAYRPSGETGLNLALRAGAQRQRRGRREDALRAAGRHRRCASTAALFETRTQTRS